MKAYFKKLYCSLVPIDDEGMELLEKIKPGDVIEVSVVKKRTDKDLRRVAQNRLMWQWLTDMQNTTVNEVSGSAKEEWHLEMKKKFLIQIYERDSQEFAETVESLRQVYRAGLKKQFNILLDIIADRTTTTDATVKQFSEYLESIERFAHNKGIILKTDPEIYQQAMN